jgi:putative membrane-bound dehydrogenase-like protein
MSIRVGLFAIICSITISCKNSTETKINFRELPEEQKRLPENALASMKVADGLEVELFASEPMLTNPTNISIDHKGRVWVCEAYNYDVSPEQEDKAGDRIIVLEDTDQDGKADKRTVFYQGTDITTPLGILVSGNQVYVTRSPHVFIFTDVDGDLVADKKDTLFTNLGKKGDHSAHSIFPGPDGMLYFSTGNFAGAINDKHGNPIVDRAGKEVNQTGNPYLGGMAMRFDEQGKRFEVLGHNFRNNYEPCIDSYGNVWQSDNDDDGNESCRVNFVMPYGNYGYLDEMTRASWSTNRVNLEKEIPERHWHQQDPGVVPNVLITGAGSPAGMAVYEGDELPGVKGVRVHAEPYYNIVRAYIPHREHAGFRATIKDLLKSDDQWFRPVDVCTAPDGSLFVADWYDPILGGGAAGDAVKGRIYRIAKDAHQYKLPTADLESGKGCVEALKSPNIETRYVAFNRLIKSGIDAGNELQDLWKSNDPILRARAFWVLAKSSDGDSVIHKALRDKDPNLRIAAIKAALQKTDDVVPYLQLVVDDSEPSVRREVATALRYSHSQEGAEIWRRLAEKYDGKDRWYLEALGIGSDLHADLYFEHWQKAVQPDLNNDAHRDIIWRSRAKQAIPLLATMIRNESEVDKTLRYFRAFDFHKSPSKNDALMSLMNLKRGNSNEITALALRQVDATEITITPALRAALSNALEQSRGTIAFVDLVAKFNMHDKKPDLMDMAVKEAGSPVGGAAVDQLMRFSAVQEIEKVLAENNDRTIGLLKSLQGKGNKAIVDAVSKIVQQESVSITVRQQAIQTLGSSWPGEEKLLALVKEKSFDSALKPVAASILFNVYRSSIQREAGNYLTKPSTNEKALPSIKQLVAYNGSVDKGREQFKKLCVACHQVKNEGAKFAPELTQIGSKLSKDGLYRAILFPDDGISYGYESTLVTLKDGSESMGILKSETDSELVLSLPGGSETKFSKSQVSGTRTTEKSLMPALAGAMSEQELVDLVTYLSSLK